MVTRGLEIQAVSKTELSSQGALGVALKAGAAPWCFCRWHSADVSERGQPGFQQGQGKTSACLMDPGICPAQSPAEAH
jgi:hypothetical protein